MELPIVFSNKKLQSLFNFDLFGGKSNITKSLVNDPRFVRLNNDFFNARNLAYSFSSRGRALFDNCRQEPYSFKEILLDSNQAKRDEIEVYEV